MSRRNRRRSRPHRHSRTQPSDIDLPYFNAPPGPSLTATRAQSRHWQAQLNSWQTKRRQTSTLLPSFVPHREAIPSEQAHAAIVAHRLQMFGGDVEDGAIFCGPMLKVVMDLFDGGLDYTDP